jgi:hypothetical protein
LSRKGKKRAISTEIANRLFAFCHGWVSLEHTGFFADTKGVERQFERAIFKLFS